MSEVKKTDFDVLSEIDLKGELKKKAKFDYLSWAKAWKIMKQHDQNAEVLEREFTHYEVVSGNFRDFLTEVQRPYQKSKKGSYVEVSVKMFGRTEKEIHAVTDYSNKDVIEPSETQVNKALKRAFVKALAKHGLGLYVYEGEDLPSAPKINAKSLEMLDVSINELASLLGEGNIEKLSKQLLTRVNKIAVQDFDHLQSVKKLEDMTIDHLGLMNREIAQGKKKLEKEDKKA